MQLLWTLALALVLNAVEGNGNDSSATDGSNRCAWLQQSGKSITRFSSMPGGGWDNLRNKDMGLVADLSFTDCTLSDDGMYVMPPNVILYARKESTVDSTSEIIDHWNNYTSSVSTSINIGTSGMLDMIGIGGKLSEEYEQVKSVVVENRLKIGRSQLRYRLYTAKMQPDFKLSAALTSRLTDIVNALINNQTKLARYLSDLVVRDFGTHAVTSVEAGGVLEKLDFFQSESVTDREFMQNKFSASMSFSFHSLLGVNIGSDTTVSSEDVDKYQKSVRKVSVRSYGGPILGPNPKLADWMQTLKENLVPVDREGEPLYGVINRHSIPNVPLTHLLQLRKEIENAVLRYYKANTVKGCQDPNSPNFDPIANVDGQCEAPVTNFTFAGVYQTCDESNPGLGINLCDGGAQLHPSTGAYSCPSGYEPVELFKTIGRSGRRCWERTHSCWLFFTCSDGQECADSYTTLRAYWCVAKKGMKLEANSGMVFGGSYASDGRFVNEITKSKTCSQFFRPYQIGRDIQLCLSMDLQAAARYRIPFAGFFACNSGNPLADPRRGLVALAGASGASAADESPKRCPDGFSQVTLDTIDGCAVMQCVKGRSGLSRIPIRRPPFEEPDYELVESPVVRVESHGWRWGYNISSHAWSFLGYFGSGSSSIASSSIASSSIASSSIGRSSPVNGGSPGPSAPQSSSGSTVAVALIGCLCGVALVALVACFARRRGGGAAIRRALCRCRRGRDSMVGSSNAGASVVEDCEANPEPSHAEPFRVRSTDENEPLLGGIA